MNGLLAMNQWVTYFDHPEGAWLGFMNAIYWLGTGITYPIAAWVANKYGRKLGVWFGYLFVLLGAILQAASHNSAAFLMARFFVGVASAWFGNCVPLLINEIAYPSHRGIANALFMSGYYVGAIVAAWTIFGTRTIESSWSWRIPSALQILLPLIALPGFLMTPQSPRWLISVDRAEEAADILTTFHAGNDEPSDLVNYQLLEITTTLQAEQANGDVGYIDLIKTPGNRWRLFISVSLGIFAQWSGNGVVSYYLALVLDTAGVTNVRDQLLISACLQIWNLIFAAGAGLSVDRFGRRPLFLISAATMAISYTVVTGLSGSFAESGNASTGIAVIPFLFLFFAGYDIAL
jgi:MFS family permease